MPPLDTVQIPAKIDQEPNSHGRIEQSEVDWDFLQWMGLVVVKDGEDDAVVVDGEDDAVVEDGEDDAVEENDDKTRTTCWIWKI